MITPPHIQLSIEVLLSAGKVFTRTVGEPGTQGLTVFGMHGAGVKKTGGGRFVDGLAGLLHMPNGGMFAFGAKSMIVAISIDVFTLPGVAVRLEGAAPKLHIIFAPPQTHSAIVNTPYFFFVFYCNTSIRSFQA